MVEAEGQLNERKEPGRGGVPSHVTELQLAVAGRSGLSRHGFTQRKAPYPS